MTNDKTFHSGYVAIIGRPNVGKSTLLNHISGMHLAITSPKPQTTRTMIRSVYDDVDGQIVFLDTPGINQPKNRLEGFMLKCSRSAFLDSDLVLLLIEASFKPQVRDIEAKIIQQAKELNKKLILVINKVDKGRKNNILPLIQVYNDLFPFEAIIPVSAKTGDGVITLLTEIKKALPEGEKFFTEDEYTDQTEKMLAAELIREQVLNQMDQEIPHGTAVAIENFEEIYELDQTTGENVRQKIFVEAVILCEKKTHKGMIIGKHAERIKEIGIKARHQMSVLFETSCDLKLFVKYRADWRNKQNLLNDLGFDSQKML